MHGTTDKTDDTESHATLVPLRHADCDAFERDLLPLLRHFLAAQLGDSSRGWHLAYGLAAEIWGERIGLPVAHGLAEVTFVWLNARLSAPDYRDPLCPDAGSLVTPDERMFLRMIHHMRRDQIGPARNCVDALTHGCMEPALIRSALAFARRHSCGQVDGVIEKPHLRAVV